MEVPEHQRIYGEHMLHDSEMRLQFQHEYALAGLKTLVLINGGAIIALLTFIGNTDRSTDGALWSFGGYAAGVTLAVLAYLFAYSSQSHFMDGATAHGYRALGHSSNIDTDAEERKGLTQSGVAMVLAVLSLIGFVGGSLGALLILA